MPENCNPSDCPMETRIASLEKSNDQHGNTHREIFSRLNAIERDNAVQNTQYKNIMDKLDDLSDKVDALEARPGKRWDGLVEKTVWAVAAALIAFLLARIGL